MSIAGNNVITRLNYIQKEVGRKVKSSKKYHQWEFSLNGNYHKIELFHSLVSGRKKLVVDGDYILKDDSDLTEEMKNTDMLYWVGTMNSIKQQAEEIVLNELIYT